MDKQATVVYTTDLKNELYVLTCKENGFKCIEVSDVRSAVYVADGIAARNYEPVIVCVHNSASRIAFAGLTEAFYRQLPVVLVSFGKRLDYSIELADVVLNHYIIKDTNEISTLLDKQMPMHIEVDTIEQNPEIIHCNSLHKKLAAVLTEDDYIYFSRNIEDCDYYRCKKVNGGTEGCYEGGIANVLGASLAKRKHKYVGLLTEKEFMLDINTLGNVNVNDRLSFIVVCSTENQYILDYANALGYRTCSISLNNASIDNMRIVTSENEKAILLIHGVY